MKLKYYKSLAHREIIKCIPKGKYRGNQRCHVNSLEYARRHPEQVKSIVGVIQVFDGNDAYCHFIVELLDGNYIDPSYGIMVDQYSYNIPIEYYKVSGFHAERDLQMLKEYAHTLLPWYKRIVTNPVDL